MGAFAHLWERSPGQKERWKRSYTTKTELFRFNQDIRCIAYHLGRS